MKGLIFWDVRGDHFNPRDFAELYADKAGFCSAMRAIDQLTNTGNVVRHIAFGTDEGQPFWYEGEIVLLDNMHVVFGKRASRYNKSGYEEPFDKSLVILMPGVDSAALKPSDYHVLIAALDWMAESNDVE